MLATPRITRLLRRSSAPPRPPSLRVTCALRLVIMHEIDIHTGRRLRADMIEPCLEIDIGIAAAPQAEIAVVGGSDKRRAALIGVGDARHGAMGHAGPRSCPRSATNHGEIRRPCVALRHLRKKDPQARQNYIYIQRQLEKAVYKS